MPETAILGKNILRGAPSSYVGSELDFDLDEQSTVVRSRLTLRRDPKVKADGASLTLMGEELELISLALDGDVLDGAAFAARVGPRGTPGNR